MTDQKNAEDLNELYGKIMANTAIAEISNWAEINSAYPTDEKAYREKAISSFRRFDKILEAALQ